MPPGLLVVWADGAPVRRIEHGVRDEAPKSVIREGDAVGLYVEHVEHYERGEQSWAHIAVDNIVALVKEQAPEMTIDASLIELALTTNSGNPHTAVSVAKHHLAKALEAHSNVLRIDIEVNTMKFAEVWRIEMRAPCPFEIPARYCVLSSSLVRGMRAETMIGAGPGTALVIQEDVGATMQQPVGWFQAGFWGHGVNSYSVYYGRATERSRVFLRLPYGAGAYERDPKAARARACETMRKYIALAETLPCKHVTLVQSQGYAHWRIERLDGSIAEKEHPKGELFSDLDEFDFEAIARATARSCALELVWSATKPFHKLVKAPCVFGRDDAPDDERLSRKHVKITPGTPHPHVEDVGSRNGTSVHGRRLTPGSYPSGTVIRAARTVGVLVTDVDEPLRTPHRAVEAARLLHELAQSRAEPIALHASYVAWAVEQTWPDLDVLKRTTRWALDEAAALGHDLLRIAETRPHVRDDRTTVFATIFERMMGAPPPFSIPDDYWVYDAWDHPEGPAEALIGTRATTPMLVERDDGGIEARPVGWFLAGFGGNYIAGQHLDARAVYYGRVTERSRVYLRLRYDDLDNRVERDNLRAKAVATMTKYIALAANLPCKHVTLQQAVDVAYWKIKRLDGTDVEMKHDPSTFSSHLDQFDFEALAAGMTGDRRA